MKKNNKGFTLIELLAVIVILAILVMVAIPSVTKYLNDARKGTFADNALTAISAVREDVIVNGRTSNCYYDLDNINKLLEKKLSTSPFGQAYSANSYVKVDISGTGTSQTVTYSICLADADSNGVEKTEAELSEGNNTDKVTLGDVTCTKPTTGYTSITVAQ